ALVRLTLRARLTQRAPKNGRVG
ncbi:MAG: hypothetical protein QOD53_348, partial [Thermoleophilaceae bacterium]|nr:hypothetical protein [Thermoleophilaceae bacterium]